MRLQPIHRIVRLDRYLRGSSGRKGLTEEDDDVLQRIELKRGRIEPTDLIDELDSDLNLKKKSSSISEELVENKFSYLQPAEDRRLVESGLKLGNQQHLLIRSNRLENIIVCKDPVSLFKLIRPKLFELNAGEIRLIYEKLNEFFSKHGRQPTSQTLNWIQNSIQRSPVFRALLDYSDGLIAELDAGCLVAMIQTFNLMDFSPDQKMVRHTLMQLNGRLNDFEFTDIVNCLTILLAYVEKPFAANHNELRKLVERLFPIAKQRAASGSLSETDTDTLVTAFHLFLNSPYDVDRRAIDRLTAMLLAPQTFITYKQALDLLAGIEKNYRSCEERCLQVSYLSAMPDLIEKCNFKIFKRFSNDPSDHFLNFYLVSVHAFPTSSKFSWLVPNFYDETDDRLLCTLVPFLHRKFFSNHRIKHLSFNFAINYAKFNIFDERLLQLIYSEFQADQYYRLNLNLRLLYGALSKFRLPFVDHPNLTDKFLFCLLNKAKPSADQSTQVSDYPALLSDLVLNDVGHEGLLDYLIGHLDEPSEQLLKQIESEDANRIRLASAYLSVFSKLNEQMKSKVKSKLDQLANGISNASNRTKTTTPREHFHADTNIKRNGYLSNGVHVEYFGVFDKSGRSVSFDDYQEHRNQIDQIPAKLKPDQKL